MTNSIGEFQFLALHGDPEPLKEQTIVLARPGVTGVAVWKTGVRGGRFTLRSVVDAESFEAARQRFADYKDSIGQNPVSLIWSDLALDGEGFQVIVLDVRPASIRGILGGVGGLNPPSLGWCECDWDLVAVTNE